MYRIFWLRNKLLRETSKEENGMQDRETDAARAAREYRERQERIDRMREETKRLDRQTDINCTIAIILSIISVILTFVLPAR